MMRRARRYQRYLLPSDKLAIHTLSRLMLGVERPEDLGRQVMRVADAKPSRRGNERSSRKYAHPNPSHTAIENHHRVLVATIMRHTWWIQLVVATPTGGMLRWRGDGGLIER